MDNPVQNLPEAFSKRIKAQFAEQAEEMLLAIKNDEIVSLRINPDKFNKTPQTPVPWCSTGFYLTSRPSFILDPLWHAGCYYVQESSSMFLEQVFKQIPNESPRMLLDLCAAPGGKSTHLLNLMNSDDFLVSNEVIHSRVNILRENIIKWGNENVLVTSRDPKDFGKLDALFDVMLIDAPCSGEGLFRKDPSAANQWTPENADLCTVRQRRILADSLPSLKEGGFLIYSTCTFNPEENEKNMDWLCQQGNFKSIPIPLKPEWQVNEINYRDIHGYRFLPHKVKGEGFFICLLQKQSADHAAFRAKSSKRREKPLIGVLPEKWIKPSDQRLILKQDDLLLSISNLWQQELLYLQKQLGLRHIGIPLASTKKNQFVPEHALAMNSDLICETFDPIDLSHSEALAYLRRQSFPFSGQSRQWRLVCYRNHPLGFIKDLGNRLNNYYPKEWRIRTNREIEGPCWYE